MPIEAGSAVHGLCLQRQGFADASGYGVFLDGGRIPPHLCFIGDPSGLVQDDDAIAELQSFGDRMGDEKHGFIF